MTSNNEPSSKTSYRLNPGRCYAAALCASAGGLDAFIKFFAAMPSESGIAFILTPHLDPTQDSHLAERLRSHTSIPVIAISEKMAVEANRIHVMSPDKYPRIANGVLDCSGPIEQRGYAFVDAFLASLADDFGERAIGIVFSGTGRFGIAGLQAIKSRGGLAIVQEPSTAEFDSMPRAVNDLGLADLVLSPQQMSRALCEHLRAKSERLPLGPGSPLLSQLGLFKRVQPSSKDLPKPAGIHFSCKELAESVLLAEFTPAAVVVNRRGEAQYYHGRIADFLNPARQMNAPLATLVNDDLQVAASVGLQQAILSDNTVCVPGVLNSSTDGAASIAITVKPIRNAPFLTDLFLVLFEQCEGHRSQAANAPAPEDGPLARRLADELRIARQDLHRTSMQLVQTIEQLQVSQEEIFTMNEELRVANEELTASLQSLRVGNDELARVNGKLRLQMIELERANDDISNLFRNNDVATVFLDRDYRIRYFTAVAAKLLHLTPEHIGTSWDDFPSPVADIDFITDARRVWKKLTPCEKELQAGERVWQLRRIALYRTRDDQIDGFVVTYANVTKLKQAAERDRLQATLLVNSEDAVIVHDFVGNISIWNRAAERMYGYTAAEALGMNMADLVPMAQRSAYRDLLERLHRGETIESAETRRLRKGGQTINVSNSATVLTDDAGHPRAVATTQRDITNRRALERELLEIAAGEQRRIGQDLHDSVGQELTGLGLLAECLTQSFKHDAAPDSALLVKMTESIHRALRQVRALSHGLIPVEIDASGLMASLADLANRVSEHPNVSCRFNCSATVAFEDNFTATHLFRIAQEAVANALRHAKPRNISISLLPQAPRIVLEIADDGTGIVGSANRAGGMGVKIMRYRAGLINAALDIESEVGKGTRIVCTLNADDCATNEWRLQTTGTTDRSEPVSHSP